MKKSLRLKSLMVASVVVLAATCMAVGCAPSATSGQTTSSSSADEAAYPEHAANCEGGAGIASYHTALGQDCASCHGDNLESQVAAVDDSGTEPAMTSTYYTDTETCLSSGCHESWEALAKRTEDLGDYNPHDSIHGTIEDCNECHKGHSDQVDICGECHPNGGQTMLP